MYILSHLSNPHLLNSAISYQFTGAYTVTLLRQSFDVQHTDIRDYCHAVGLDVKDFDQTMRRKMEGQMHCLSSFSPYTYSRTPSLIAGYETVYHRGYSWLLEGTLAGELCLHSSSRTMVGKTQIEVGERGKNVKCIIRKKIKKKKNIKIKRTMMMITAMRIVEKE